jgi:hypothetical protein
MEQAAALGRMLASSLNRVSALHEAVDSYPVLAAMRSQYVWFVPMLEVLLCPQATELRRDLAIWLEDATHDSARRLERIVAMDSAPGLAYSTMESEFIERGLATIAMFESSSAGVGQLAHPATIERCETKLEAATGLLWGRSEAIVRATPPEVVAYCLNVDSRHIVRRLDPTSEPRFELVERVNHHHTVCFYRVRLGSGLSDRTLLMSVISKRLAEHPPTYAVVVISIPSHAKITAKDEAGAVRAENRRVFRITEISPGRSKVEYACSLNMQGLLPQFVINAFVLPTQMSAPVTQQLYFQQLLPLGDCDAEDGRFVGHMLMAVVDSKPKDLPHAIRTFANQMAMLRECCCPRIGDMLVALLSSAMPTTDAPSAADDAPAELPSTLDGL